MQFNVLKLSSFLPALFFVCNGSGFEPYKDSYNKTMLAHEKNHIQDNQALIPNDEGLSCFFLRLLNMV